MGLLHSRSRRKREVIYIEIGEDKDKYTFLIYNNGPQIPANQLEEIFRQGVTTKKEQGHGMGLFIVSRILKESGGTVEVTSTKEQTSFLVGIPKAFQRDF